MHAPRILVVEDEAIVAIDLQCQLRKLGYDVPDPVASGDRALLTIEQSRPDLVLMDIGIQGELDGIATASRIPPDYRIPVIYLTAHSEASVVSRAGATNPYGYLLKPCSEIELHTLIQLSLARSVAEREPRAPGPMFTPPVGPFGGMAAPDPSVGSAAAPWPDVAKSKAAPTQASLVSWQKSGGTLFAAARSAEGAIRHRLIVEQLPFHKGWDWAVWRPGDPCDFSRHGHASSAVTAMSAAENAARYWAQSDD